MASPLQPASDGAGAEHRRTLDYGALYNVAVAHAGHFTTRQAADVGFSPQALRKHVLAGRVVRVLHGIYRLVHYPADDLEQLAVLDLWADGHGTTSSSRRTNRPWRAGFWPSLGPRASVPCSHRGYRPGSCHDVLASECTQLR